MKKIIIVLAILVLGWGILMFVDKNYKDIGVFDVWVMSGESMEPTLYNGDKLRVDKEKEVVVGDIIIFNYQTLDGPREFIKRVQSITPEGKYFVVGDNLEKSLDSRMFGPIEKSSIIGVATKR